MVYCAQGITTVVSINYKLGHFNMDPRIQYLLAVAPTVLLLAIMLAGIILGILQRRKHRLASLLVIPGLIALSANVMGTVAIRSYARHQSFDRYEDATVVAQHLAAMHVGLFALNFIGITLITAAVFADRGVIRIGRLTIGSSGRGPKLRRAKGVDR